MSATSLDAWQSRIAAAIDGYDGSGPLRSASALDVYQRNSIGARLLVLRERYPVLGAVLGRAYFVALASRYIATHSSDTADLNRYGGSFADWVASRIPRRNELAGMPYLGDLARLEQAWAHAGWRGLRSETPAVDGLSATPQAHETLRLRLNPSLGRVDTRFGILALWRRHRNGRPSRPVAALARAERLAIFRPPGAAPRIDRLDAGLALALKAIIDRASLVELARTCPARDLARCVERGYILGLDAGHAPC